MVKDKQAEWMKDKANALEVQYFEPTAGLDAETCQIFNDYCHRLRDTFEKRMYTLASQNAEMSHKLELYQTQK
jgi:ABC-type transporter Mla maintaining outer membrane lipid asymmetry ATPase subunit MlaF